jgi:hypothetical protein
MFLATAVKCSGENRFFACGWMRISISQRSSVNALAWSLLTPAVPVTVRLVQVPFYPQMSLTIIRVVQTHRSVLQVQSLEIYIVEASQAHRREVESSGPYTTTGTNAMKFWKRGPAMLLSFFLPAAVFVAVLTKTLTATSKAHHGFSGCMRCRSFP